MEEMMQGGERENMITSAHVPSMNIIRKAYDHAAARLLVEGLLFSLADAMGTTNTASSFEAIADDVISGYGDLKITEVALAFRMMREGRIRINDRMDSLGRNAAEMYGRLTSATICDCLHRYRYEYRNQVLARHEQELAAEARRHAAPPATPEERRRINMAGYLYRCRPCNFAIITTDITPQDMRDLEYYAAERKAGILLRRRVEQFLAGEIDQEALRKGVNYLNENFPINEDTTDPLVFKK